ncbi:MAG TPA: peptidylprolyl isomerase [Candidatus Deferrimicrobium sp.]|nr:peptidylprolyl isomerase [Candidatus Deferrimicrobium sp.]
MGKKKDKAKMQSQKSGKVPQGKVRASHILVEKLIAAQDIKDQLASGANFKELAMKYSTCPSKKRGGDLGIFGRGDMVPEFERAVYKMNIGEISDPIKTKHGYHIIQRTG